MTKKRYLQNITIVNFYDAPIFTGLDPETQKPVVPLKHIVEEHLGLHWETQRQKLQDSELYETVLADGACFDNPAFKPNATYICLPYNDLNLFLCQINAARIGSRSRRDNLIMYQKECGSALHDYWNRGFAMNRRTNPSDINCQDEHESPRKLTMMRLDRAADSYADYHNRNFDTEIKGSDIVNTAHRVINNILMPDDPDWDEISHALEFQIAFMEKASADILFMCIQSHVDVEQLDTLLEDNITACWDHLSGKILTLTAPFEPFPGANNSRKRELIRG